MSKPIANHSGSTGIHRRTFLADVGMGFTGLALGAMLGKEDAALASSAREQAVNDGVAHHRPKAKNVIWIFLIGGMSQMESFDPKPELNRWAGKTYDESPFKNVLDSPYLKKNLRELVEGLHKVHPKIYEMQVGYRRFGESGLEISDWWPHVGQHADDLAIVRSMWTTDNNHGAQLQFHTGRHVLEGQFPTIGSWVHYGLGSLNENLPQFAVIGTPIADCCGGVGAHGANYLGPEHNGVQLAIDPKNPLPFASPGPDVYREEQIESFGLLNRLNRLSAVEYPEDRALAARIRSYELAFRMQTAIPGIVDFGQETQVTHERYGFNNPATKTFGEQCLAARRLVEQGVRFVQIFHGSNGGAGAWDAHGSLKAGHSRLCGEVDQPIAALIADLKQRGLLDETLIVIGTEFGRTPGAQGSDGRDHHPYGFSVVLAGGGVRGGIAHGKTDELGFHAVEDRHYVTDLHATVLHQLGLDPRRMEIPGRKRLDLDFGKPIDAILA
ncbi:DUF1501 domain-containing protein [Schlesneria paludicola]|uniref:DUF1501 domain-containing protein n=1 Tax=Schlesneria paludicola TaxID=360056 RepID=UPI00029A114B|nr:DUF1501 domain-containing protein [Schlesneria paludicola]